MLPLRADRARALAILERRLEPGGYVVATIHREANVAARAARPDRRRARTARRAGRLPGAPAHARGIERGEVALAPHVELVAPLGYLDLAALASQARVIVTDSGGLQKEAYWYGVPCVTRGLRTEWVDTVELGANVLVDDDPSALAAAVAAARPLPADRPPLYGDGRASERIAAALAGSAATPMKRDVAIVGAGYVGVPLAQVFAEAGRSVLLVDVSAGASTQLNRGESYIEDVPSRDARSGSSTRGLRRDDRLRRARARPTRS